MEEILSKKDGVQGARWSHERLENWEAYARSQGYLPEDEEAYKAFFWGKHGKPLKHVPIPKRSDIFTDQEKQDLVDFRYFASVGAFHKVIYLKLRFGICDHQRMSLFFSTPNLEDRYKYTDVQILEMVAKFDSMIPFTRVEEDLFILNRKMRIKQDRMAYLTYTEATDREDGNRRYDEYQKLEEEVSILEHQVKAETEKFQGAKRRLEKMAVFKSRVEKQVSELRYPVLICCPTKINKDTPLKREVESPYLFHKGRYKEFDKPDMPLWEMVHADTGIDTLFSTLHVALTRELGIPESTKIESLCARFLFREFDFRSGSPRKYLELPNKSVKNHMFKSGGGTVKMVGRPFSPGDIHAKYHGDKDAFFHILMRYVIVLYKYAQAFKGRQGPCTYDFLSAESVKRKHTYRQIMWPTFYQDFPMKDGPDYSFYRSIARFHPYFNDARRFRLVPKLTRRFTRKEREVFGSVIDVSPESTACGRVIKKRVFAGKGKGYLRTKDGRVVIRSRRAKVALPTTGIFDIITRSAREYAGDVDNYQCWILGEYDNRLRGRTKDYEKVNLKDFAAFKRGADYIYELAEDEFCGHILFCREKQFMRYLLNPDAVNKLEFQGKIISPLEFGEMEESKQDTLLESFNLFDPSGRKSLDGDKPEDDPELIEKRNTENRYVT